MAQRTNSTPAAPASIDPKPEPDPLEVDGESQRYAKIAEDTFARMCAEPEGRELILKIFVLLEEFANVAANAVLRALPYVARVDAAPPVDGYEDLFADRLFPDKVKYSLMIRFLAYAVLHLGAQFVRERNDARLSGVGPLLTKIGNPSAGSLSTSRAAKRLLVLLRGEAAESALTLAIDEAGFPLSYRGFKALVKCASRRDEEAVTILRAACRRIRSKLSNVDGPPLKYHTGVHFIFIVFLRNLKKAGAYTYTANGKIEDAETECLDTRSQHGEDDNNFHDYTDELTLATRRALKNRNFRPSRSILLLNSGQFRLADGSVPRSRFKGAASKAF